MSEDNQHQTMPSEGNNDVAAEDKAKRLEAERDEYLNGWKRAKADLINYQRDETQRIESLVKFGSEGMLKELIVVMDSFDLAMAVEKEDKGLVLIRSQLEGVLKKYNLEPVKSLHERFNPAFHEVIAEVESDLEEGMVVEEVGRGWKLHEKVIRPARVKVSKGKGMQ